MHLLVDKREASRRRRVPDASAAIGEAEYENEDFYDEPTCEFCGCSKSVWCEHDLL